MESKTVDEITKLIKSLPGFEDAKTSGLRKSELIEYYYGAVKMINDGTPLIKKDASINLNIVSTEISSDINWLNHLHIYGWAVADIPDFDSNFARKEMLNWLGRICKRFDPDDRNTWKKKNIPYNSHGIFKHYISQTELMWYCRDKTKDIFARIWGDNDLLVSFDGGCFLPSGNLADYKQWLHLDQGRSLRTFCSVQGIVALTDHGINDGGTVLLNNSSHKFSEYLDKHPCDGIGNSFFPVDPKDFVYSGCEIIKPILKAGQILLFDSRTPHYNIAPTPTGDQVAVRMCTYVSFMPRHQASLADLNKRIRAFQQRRNTGHWAYGPYFTVCPAQPNPLRANKDCPKQAVSEIEVAEMNNSRYRMIGF